MRLGVRVRALLVFLPLAAITTGGFCIRPPPPPEPDRCEAASPIDLTNRVLEVGSDGASLQMRPFVPLADGDQVAATDGAQGGTMIGIRLRVSGAPEAELPDCLPQISTLADEDGETFARLAVSLRTYPHGDDARITDLNWLIFDGRGPRVGSTVTLVVEAGGLRLERHLELVDFVLPRDLGARD